MELKHVHSDKRRDISVVSGLLDGTREFSFINLHAGRAIGGCMHDEDECFMIVSGVVDVVNGEERKTYRPGDGGVFKAGQPHAFYASVDDAIVCEWGITEDAKKNTTYDPRLRQLVADINELHDTTI